MAGVCQVVNGYFKDLGRDKDGTHASAASGIPIEYCSCQTIVKLVMPRTKVGVCPLCLREADLTFHHFIPRKVHRRAHFKKHFNKDQLQEGVGVCRQCHSGIHRFYDEMYLAKQLNDLPSLRNDEALRAHFQWVARQRIQ